MPLTPLGVLPQHRQSVILDRLAREGRVVAAQLAREFGTSEDTIRRDLRELASTGHCRRVYGGALPLSPAFGTLAERKAEAPLRKAALAAACAKLIETRMQLGRVLFLDAGSTNLAIARALPPGLQAVVATNAPDIAAVLIQHERLELMMIGGRIDRRTGAALGGRALRDAREIRADLAILGACAVSAAIGLAAFDAEEAEFKKTVAAGAASVAAAVINDRLGASAPFTVIPTARLATLVVEADAPPAEVALLGSLGVEVVPAGSGERA